MGLPILLGACRGALIFVHLNDGAIVYGRGVHRSSQVQMRYFGGELLDGAEVLTLEEIDFCMVLNTY